MTEKQILRLTSHYLENYEGCPLYFHRIVNLKRGEPSALPSMARGTAIHHLLANYYRGMQSGVEFDANIENCIALFDTDALGINGLLVEDIPLIASTFYDYTSHYRDKDNFKILSVEESLSKVLYEDDQYIILYEGTQDLNIQKIDGDIMPVDHKSESSKWSVSQLNNQFLGYCFLTGSNRMLRNAIGLQKTKPPAEKYYRTMYSYSNAIIDWWKRMTAKKGLEILAHYAADDWNLSGNLYACDTLFRRGCGFRAVCSEEESEWERILNEEYVEVPLYA